MRPLYGHHLITTLFVLSVVTWCSESLSQEQVTPVNRVQLKKWYEQHGLPVPADLVPYQQPVILDNPLLSPPNEVDVRVFPSSNPQTENSIAVNQANPLQLMISTNGTIASTGQTWFFSTNGGATWFGSETSPNSVSNYGDPVALFNSAGTYAHWVTLRSPGGIGFVRTTNLGTTWLAMTNADPLSSTNDDKEHAMTDLSGVYPNNVYAAWTDFGVGSIGSRCVVTRSQDNGATWSSRITLSTGSDQGQGVNLAVGPNGEVYCAMANYTGGFLPESGIRFARSTDGGASWTAAGIAFSISGIRTTSGGIAAYGGTRVNSFPSMGVDRSVGARRGWIYIVYADRNTGDADVYLRRSTDLGTTWTSAIRVNGETVGNGKPQWFPSIAVDATNGDISVGYYSMDSTGSNYLTNRYIAHSTDGGTTFERFVVSDVRFTPSALGGGFAAGYCGDYYETAAYGARAWACWSDNRSGAFQAYVSRATYASTITVGAPNGGESWAIGSSQTITWSSSGVSGNVRIQLSRNGGSSFTETLFASTANDGTEPWTVTGPVTSTARIRITAVADSTIADTSNANFSIVQPGITVTSPNGGESWFLSSTQTILWTSVNLTGNVRIDLSTDGGATFPTTVSASTANDGSEPWTITGVATTSARIRVSSLSITSVADTSNGNFTIAQPTITVTSPNGSENWPIGSAQTILWASSNVSGNVTIDLSTDGGLTFPLVVAAGTANDGAEPWTVSGTATTSARIRISSAIAPTVTDMSNGNFTLVQPTVTVSAPNGGEVWAAGSVQSLQWTSTNVTGNVKVELSRDGGVTFPEVLFASTTNDGSEPWTVSGPGTTQARIRISSVTVPSASDISNANFTITQPSVTVLSPNGGEVWGINTPHIIQWTSMLVSGPVNIELSRDGGVTYEMLFAGTANDGSEPWTLTAPPTTNALVRITSVNSPGISDLSNAPFTISATFTFLAKLYLHDAGGASDSLEFGTAAGATDTIDAAYGEIEQPPVPPTEVLDVRWQIAGTQGTKRDVRDTLGGTHQQIIYRGMMQPGVGGYPFVLRWKRLELPPGSFILRDASTGSFSISMGQQDSLVVTDPFVQLFQIVYTLGTTVTSTLEQGWNITSVPVVLGDRRRTTLFPNSISAAFEYTPSGYVGRDTLNYGTGYWLRFPSTESVNLTGGTIAKDTIDVVQGWNIIGSISTAVPVSSIIQIPGGIVASQYFQFTGGLYSPASSISPMVGYWVKVTQNGRLVLSGASARQHGD